jgi:hypothetical protein
MIPQLFAFFRGQIILTLAFIQIGVSLATRLPSLDTRAQLLGDLRVGLPATAPIVPLHKQCGRYLCEPP